MTTKRKTVITFLFATMLMASTEGHSQTHFNVELQMSAASGDYTPLWLNANKYGLSSLEKTNGYVRMGAFRPTANDSTKKWGWGYGADVAIAANYTSTIVVQQAYGEIRWLKGLLTVGSKEQPMELKNQQLSTGSQTLGINARPVPAIRLSLPDYWDVPYTRHWLGLKGHIAYGMQTDDSWQEDFTKRQNDYTNHSKLHTKAGYLRLGRPNSLLTIEAGLEMACQYGGTAYVLRSGGIQTIDNEDGLHGAWHAFIPGGGDSGEGLYKNKSGNHLGSYLLRATLSQPQWEAAIYADHFFEDHSQMFFIDYDGYGEGEQYNDWVDDRYLFYGLHDIMLGAEVKLKNQKWLNDIVAEYVYTKYQSGPVYHDRTQLMSDHIGGRDNYYNHHIFPGWQHWGQTMGNPLYRSPLYNSDSKIETKDNRFWAWHLGFSGTPLPQLHYRLLVTWQRGWGTYDNPLPNPERNLSLLAEAEYTPCQQSPLHDWTIKLAGAMDRGKLLGDNTGLQLTVARHFKTR